jgi:hypothetical protein
MGGLIIVIIGFLLSVICGIKMGITMAADDIYNQHRINASEYQHMNTWEYVTEMLQKEIRKHD